MDKTSCLIYYIDGARLTKIDKELFKCNKEDVDKNINLYLDKTKEKYLQNCVNYPEWSNIAKEHWLKKEFNFVVLFEKDVFLNSSIHKTVKIKLFG